jgi:hypothetical protein
LRNSDRSYESHRNLLLMPCGLGEKTISCLITGILLTIIGSKHCIS